MNIASFLASTVVAALVACFVSVFSAERKIKVENVTQERAKWRDRIRKKSLRVERFCSQPNAAELKRLRLDFALNLNPHDPEDKAILAVISKLATVVSPEMNQVATVDLALQEFTDRVALLLKHDWDRAKAEADPTENSFSRRVSYSEFVAADARLGGARSKLPEANTSKTTNGQQN